MLSERFGVSERRACRVAGQHRSTQRLDRPAPSLEERRLRAWLRAFATRRPRWGWRRAAKQARREGWVVNDKRIQRLWRDEGLKVPYRKRKKPLRGIGTAVGAMCPIAPNALWALDFQFDVSVDGRTLKLLNIVDEYTRECPAIVVDRGIDADRVVAALDRITLERGAPAFLRFDHGPEFIAYAVAEVTPR
jgi:putative transposase